MADSPQEIQKQVKKILLIGAILIFFTVVTVALSYVELPSHSLNIIVGMILATIKAALVALVFMHLNHEAKLVYKILAFTVAFVLALFLLFYFSVSDPLVFKDF
ncbi:MAG: cytochrome C oxidase subunit IV family protein [Verrucomicrobiota bacterium]